MNLDRLSSGIKALALPLAFGLLQVFGCMQPSEPQADKVAPPSDTIVSNNLFKIGLILVDQVGDRTHYAESFSELKLSPSDGKLFVCPGRELYSISNIQSWTDYIYIGKTPVEMVPGAALVISPPENHGGNCGYVLFGTLQVLRLPSQTVRALINKPYLFATNTAPEVLEYFKREVKICVPERFESEYSPDK